VSLGVRELASSTEPARHVVHMFTRRRDTVRWETRLRNGGGLELNVLGPGALRRSYGFDDADSLVAHQVQLQRQLMASGYDAVGAYERRTGYDRRRHRRLVTDRRKP
jgi:hypothetical protein